MITLNYPLLILMPENAPKTFFNLDVVNRLWWWKSPRA